MNEDKSIITVAVIIALCTCIWGALGFLFASVITLFIDEK